MNDYQGMELRKFVAPEFVFGIDARSLVGRYARNFAAKRALIVTDPGLVSHGWVDQVQINLEQENIPSIVYSDIDSNPDANQVMRGAEVYTEENCNLIVAIGGGSPMDCAKGIGIVSSNHRDIRDFEGVDKVPIPAPPLICIPTTAGSSADVSQFAIISDKKEKIKMAIISKTLVPDVALIDPITTTTMDANLTAATAFDTLCHAIEAIASNASSPITNIHAWEAIKLVSSHLISLMQEPQDLSLRGKLMLASLHAGLAFSNASLGLIHAMAHSLGGLLDLPHGDCNAILLDYVINFNYNGNPHAYRAVGEALGLKMGLYHKKNKEDIINFIRKLKNDTDMGYGLEKVGVGPEHFPFLVARTMLDPCIVTNPIAPTPKEVEEIFRNAL